MEHPLASQANADTIPDTIPAIDSPNKLIS